jgi:hypothetical protein
MSKTAFGTGKIIESLGSILKMKLVSFPGDVDPQIIGALGAAVTASEK